MVLKPSNVPSMPGVYIFKGQKERALYVGKAKNLKNRLESYFQGPTSLGPRKAKMVRMINAFSYIVTDNELEALILEANLIKQHKPMFNIILRDDKNYPYIKLTINEEWPKIEVVRKIQQDGNLYLGPYVPAQAMWEAVTFIRRNFMVRTCRYSLDKPIRSCIQYQTKRCSAPCAGHINREQYMKAVEDVRFFLMGKKKELLGRLEDNMQRLANDMKFEEAAKIRDRIFKLQQAFESQKVIAPELGDVDVIGYCKEGDNVGINVLFVRNGILIGAKDFFIERVMMLSESEIMHSFVELFYAKKIIPPATVLINVLPDDINTLTEWLKNKKGEKVKIEAPKKGKKEKLLMMANENARLRFNLTRSYRFKKRPSPEETLKALKDLLNLAAIPSSIGAFDVSTIHGSESVGAFIFWEAGPDCSGEFKKDQYRHLRIKGVQGVDDYSMMREIIERILITDIQSPDLIIIDGGRGQLEAARGVVDELGIKTEIIGIAKKPDRAFLLSGEVVDLEDGGKASLLLKRIRDEAHRFAISFHRKLRDKRLMKSSLDNIAGIGKKRRLELLRFFGSIDNIKKASADEIIKVRGFSRKMAENLLKNIKTGVMQ